MDPAFYSLRNTFVRTNGRHRKLLIRRAPGRLPRQYSRGARGAKRRSRG
jgi:hypothetical protein